MDHHTSPKTEVKANGFSSTEFMVPRQSLKGPWTNGSQMSHDQSMAWPSNPQYHWIGWRENLRETMVFPMKYRGFW